MQPSTTESADRSIWCESDLRHTQNPIRMQILRILFLHESIRSIFESPRSVRSYCTFSFTYLPTYHLPPTYLPRYGCPTVISQLGAWSISVEEGLHVNQI